MRITDHLKNTKNMVTNMNKNGNTIDRTETTNKEIIVMKDLTEIINKKIITTTDLTETMIKDKILIGPIKNTKIDHSMTDQLKITSKDKILILIKMKENLRESSTKKKISFIRKIIEINIQMKTIHQESNSMSLNVGLPERIIEILRSKNDMVQSKEKTTKILL